jgi:ATPase subunit of ABC transporter with duplicated ATPase domains
LFDSEEFGEEFTQDAEKGEGIFADLAAQRDDLAAAGPLKLKRVRLANILGFKDATIYPEDFSVLVGANNSGKSTLMRAVAFAQTLLRVHLERKTEKRIT